MTPIAMGGAHWREDLRQAARTGADILVSSSGSQGAAKIFLRSLASWRAAHRHEIQAMGLSQRDVVLGGGRAGFSLVPYAALLADDLGAPFVHWQKSGDGARPTVLYAAPPLLLPILSDCDLSSLRWIVTGGAHLTAALRQRIKRLCPQAKIIFFYGAAETGMVAWTAADEDALRPFPGVEIEWRDGMAWVRSPYGVKGLWRDDALAPIQDAKGWIALPDDVQDEQGALRVIGRRDGFLNVAGMLVSPDDIEAFLAEQDGVEEAAIIALRNRYGEWPLAIWRGAATAQDLRAACRRHLSPAQRPRRWVHWAGDFPRLDAGKIDRRLLAEKALWRQSS